MRRTTLLNFASAGAFLCVQTIGVMFAQDTGAGTPQGQNPPSGMTAPGQNTGQAPAGGIPVDTMPNRVDDRSFVKEAVVNSLAEMELGKLAAQKASKDEIKRFGEKLAADHSKANEQLKQVAGKENIHVPEALDSKHRSQIDKLAKLDGDEFDKAFVKEQLKGRQAAVRDFDSEAQSGTDPALRTFASNMLPTLQQQLQTVKDLSKSEKNSGK